MITLLLIFVPLAAAVLAYSAKNMRKVIRLILLAGAALHSMLTLLAFTMLDAGKTEELSFAWKETGLLGLDTLGMIFLSITSLLFLIVSIHTLFWLPAEEAVDKDRVHNGTAHESGLLREHIFLPCLLAFLSMMTLVICSRNFGLLWVAVEATTLVSAPLICFHRSPHSLEAMWKYLLICSVGIGLALFGTMLTGVAGQTASGALGLNFDTLKENAGQLHTGWFKAAFIFILVGYGTKMGLAPFHTWLPDAHSEAPGTVSALLSGSLLNCSFLGIIRFCTITPEVLRPFCNGLLVALGLLSLAVAAFFIIRQSDFKRMLAYSSVEHMGLAVILWGIGAESVTMFHLCGHSVIKMTLFLTAGNILLAYGTRSVSAVGGNVRDNPEKRRNLDHRAAADLRHTAIAAVRHGIPAGARRSALAGRLGARSAVRRFRRNVDGVPENGNGKKRNTGKNIVSGKAGGKIVGHAVLRRCHSTGVRHNASVDTEYGETLI